MSACAGRDGEVTTAPKWTTRLASASPIAPATATLTWRPSSVDAAVSGLGVTAQKVSWKTFISLQKKKLCALLCGPSRVLALFLFDACLEHNTAYTGKKI